MWDIVWSARGARGEQPRGPIAPSRVDGRRQAALDFKSDRTRSSKIRDIQNKLKSRCEGGVTNFDEHGNNGDADRRRALVS